MYNLNGKKALILGGTSGIGLAVAASYVNAGASVVITGRRPDGKEIAERIGAQFFACDITDEQAVKQLLHAIEGQVGLLDILVINAGTALDEGSVEEFSSEEMSTLVDINFKGAFYALKYAPSKMQNGSSIIFTGSVAGSGITHAGSGVYSATKAAGAYLVRTSAIENAPRGIRVNCVCPALIADTGMMVPDDGSETAAFLSKLNAFGRMGRQDEVVGIYNFLAGDGSTFITGQEIRVDGGMSAGIGLPVFEALSTN